VLSEGSLQDLFRVSKKWGIVLAGLTIRLCLAPFTAHPSDMSLWEYFGRTLLVEHGNPYATFAYPPPWIYVTGAMYSLYLLFPNEFFLNLILKFPIILGDILMGLTIYSVVLDLSGSQKKADYALALFLLNPYVIWISSAWGMFDVLPALCTFLALRFFLRGQKKVSALLLGLGIAFKYYPALLLPLLLMLEWRDGSRISSVAQYIFYVSLPLIITSAPFMILDWNSFLRQLFSSSLMIHGMWNTPVSYLAFLYILRDLSPNVFNQLMNNFWWSNILSYSLFVMLYFLMMARLRKVSGSTFEFLNNSFLATLLVFFLSSKMVNEQYFIWALPFIIVNLTFNSENKILFEILWPAIFAFFSVNVPLYNFIPDVQRRTYNYTAFLAPLVDFYENGVPAIYKSTSLFILGLTISVVCALYFSRLLKTFNSNQTKE